MTRWHPASILLVGCTFSAVAGMWTFAWLNGDLTVRELAAGAGAFVQARLLLRIPRGQT